MIPEIARRCKTCGAAVRNHAGFCPQCGASLNPEESNLAATVGASESQLNQTEEAIVVEEPHAPSALAVTIGDAAAAPVNDVTPVSDVAPVSEKVTVSDAAPANDPPVVVASEEVVSSPDATTNDDRADGKKEDLTAESHIEAGASPTRRHRVKVAALDAVEGKIAPRVEKLRQASTVMLDEAADDPGLRFVLVAAVLILLSLVLLLLSQTLG